MPRSSKRKGVVSARAQQTRAAQTKSDERRKMSLSQYRFRRAIGWSLVGLAVVVGVSHWMSHLGLWAFAPQGVMDLVAGYPMAALLGVAGAITLSKT